MVLVSAQVCCTAVGLKVSEERPRWVRPDRRCTEDRTEVGQKARQNLRVLDLRVELQVEVLRETRHTVDRNIEVVLPSSEILVET